MTAIAYLGPPGTWSEVAAKRWGGLEARLIPVASLHAVVHAVERGQVDIGVLPLENSWEGVVGMSLDVLIGETELMIRAELVLPVRHALLVQPGARLDDIRVVRSHPQALAQCRRFLTDQLPHAATAPVSSTSAAVAAVVEEPGSAAIAAPGAAELYPVAVVARDIQDQPDNATRFVVVAATDAPATGDDKTTVAFRVEHIPGSLIAVLAAFERCGIVFTTLHSRPVRGHLGQHLFLGDLHGHRAEPHIAEALGQAAAKASWFKVLGSYPAWRDEEPDTLRM